MINQLLQRFHNKIMKHSNHPTLLATKNIALLFSVLSSTLCLTIIPVAALSTAATTTSSGSSTASTPAAQARLQLIISRGNTEISRRLTVLDTLTTKITSSTKLSNADQQTLSSEVSGEIGGLTSLKTKLDADTSLTTAIPDAQAIFADYRVFALVVPQVNLIKTADQQQITEGKLAALATKIQADITVDQTSGRDVTNLQIELNALSVKTAAAQAISSGIENGVITLTPSDYNTNHAVLSGDRNQLKTAQEDISAAISDAKTLVSNLKTLS